MNFYFSAIFKRLEKLTGTTFVHITALFKKNLKKLLLVCMEQNRAYRFIVYGFELINFKIC